ncbi:hypothetical protein CXF72_01290 [Psychromonas sp. MB-3u-54]|uniref:hypothetical protein n=1 Tax=Psychromonas sp. MB-3u-54 TaxID=2058319 RepID=UPI000C34E0F1|nr:hypothetical protein [Psychromonas sp. MB-3u-54]PKH04404.1 hypothetical protein CXF72_01290 [Psychromonas sp. MB-3u-54]
MEASKEFKQPMTACMGTGSKFMGCASAANGDVINHSDIKLCTDVSEDAAARVYLLPKVPHSGKISQAISLIIRFFPLIKNRFVPLYNLKS